MTYQTFYVKIGCVHKFMSLSVLDQPKTTKHNLSISQEWVGPLVLQVEFELQVKA